VTVETLPSNSGTTTSSEAKVVLSKTPWSGEAGMKAALQGKSWKSPGLWGEFDSKMNGTCEKSRFVSNTRCDSLLICDGMSKRLGTIPNSNPCSDQKLNLGSAEVETGTYYIGVYTYCFPNQASEILKFKASRVEQGLTDIQSALTAFSLKDKCSQPINYTLYASQVLGVCRAPLREGEVLTGGNPSILRPSHPQSTTTHRTNTELFEGVSANDQYAHYSFEVTDPCMDMKLELRVYEGCP